MNEPTNYTVRWRLADGEDNSATLFASFEDADIFANNLRNREHIVDVKVLRAGRHPSSTRWLTSTRASVVRRTRKTTDSLTVHEDAWIEPVGFVDGDADKHGPAIYIPVDERAYERTDTEKAEWARTYKPTIKTCLWQ